MKNNNFLLLPYSSHLYMKIAFIKMLSRKNHDGKFPSSMAGRGMREVWTEATMNTDETKCKKMMMTSRGAMSVRIEEKCRHPWCL